MHTTIICDIQAGFKILYQRHLMGATRLFHVATKAPNGMGFRFIFVGDHCSRRGDMS